MEQFAEHRQSQTQTISPRLQHAVRLLQMSSQDFLATVHDLLGKNPFLEGEDGSEDGAERASGAAAVDAAGSDAPADLDGGAAFDDDREMWHATNASTSLRRADESELSALELVAEEISLQRHLQEQLSLMKLPARELLLAALIAETVDDDGYLRVSLDELAATAAAQGLKPAPAATEMEAALARVQALDPLGVGARDVAECLRLQLPAIACPETRALAAVIVTCHLPLLAARDHGGLAELLQIERARAEAVCQRLRRLDPRPGWRIGSQPAPYIVPDVLTKKVGREWRVQLNPAVIPRLRLNRVYAELYQRHRGRANSELSQHLHEARWTLRNIDTRFATILEVAEAIVRRQRHFLDFGPMAMKPLALREIADEVGVHESTVSRVTNNKFIATPGGVYELKYFFSRPMISRNGSACSGTAIRGLIKDIIAAESPQSPLSDAEITRQLGAQGLILARRTVTKYRQILHIESVERRRSLAPAGSALK